MKWAVSNIAWDPRQTQRHLDLIASMGVHGLELAPSLLWPDLLNVPDREVAQLVGWVKGRGLEVTGFHALLYGRPDLVLFGDSAQERDLINYFLRLAGLCSMVGGKTLILGSPQNRRRGSLGPEEAWLRAVDLFRRLAERVSPFGVCLCIEPLSPAETDFIQSTAEGRRMVESVQHPAFGLHLDVRAMHDSHEDFAQEIRGTNGAIRHVHVSDPGLTMPGQTGQVDHRAAGRALRSVGYHGYVSIEMRRREGPMEDLISQAVAFVRAAYGENDGGTRAVEGPH